MRAPTDLHPDDLAYRIGLRDMLIARRQQLGYSQLHLANLLDRPQSAVARFEVSQPWRIEPTQQIAHALDLRLVMFPHNLPGGPYEPNDPDPRLDPFQQHLADRRHLIGLMVAARRAAHVTQADLAAALDVRVNVLGRLETSLTGGLMLATCQRYLRALDGELWIGAEPLDPTATVVSPLSPLLMGTAA